MVRLKPLVSCTKQTIGHAFNRNINGGTGSAFLRHPEAYFSVSRRCRTVRGDGKAFVVGVWARHSSDAPFLLRAESITPQSQRRLTARDVHLCRLNHQPAPVDLFRARPYGFAQGRFLADSGEPAPRLGTVRTTRVLDTAKVIFSRWY